MQRLKLERNVFILFAWLIIIAIALSNYFSWPTHRSLSLGLTIVVLGCVAFTLVTLRFCERCIKINEHSATVLKEQKIYISKLEDHNSYFRSRVDVMEKVIAIVGHDLRSPIGDLRMMVRHYLMAPLSQDDVKEYMEKLVPELNSMLDLANRLLHWVTINISEAVSVEPIYVKQEFTALLSMYQRVAESKGVTIINSIPEKLILFQDLSLLSIVVRNLVDNAIKFTPAHGQVIVGCVEQGADLFRFFVSNSSNGISNEMIKELLFTNNSVSTKNGSHGLGIFLCKEYLQKLDSALMIENGPLDLVTFCFDVGSQKRSV